LVSQETISLSSYHKDFPFNLRFLDLKNFLPPGSLDDNVRAWGGKVNKHKCLYEAIDEETFQEDSLRTDPYAQSDFFNTLTNEGISDADYTDYLVEAAKHPNRLAYLLHYNERDVEVMPEIIDQLIEINRKFDVDMLRCVSLSACAAQAKYNTLYEGFDFYENYSDNTITTFKLTPEFFKAMIKGYNLQNKKKHKNTVNNITEKDYETIRNMIEKGNCYQCGNGFTLSNKPTLDRQNNDLGHTLQNMKPCCCYCNRFKSDKDRYRQYMVKLMQYARLHNIPFTLCKG
jgi:hypothetical protein